VKLVETDIDLSTLIISEEQLAVRTPGVHVSSIIRHIGNQIGTNKGNGFTEDDLGQMAAIGRLWEKLLADVLFPPPRYERVGEIEKDGIIGSPDCIDIHEWVDNEAKVTWVSSRNFMESHKFREYLYQCRAYCHMLSDATPMLKAKLWVLHVCGDHRPPLPMKGKGMKVYECTFTPQELRDNWMMLQRNVPGGGNG
jgi:hypothetical protein